VVALRSGRWSNRNGKVRLGCLFTLLLLAVGMYYGVPVGSMYLRYWRLNQEMKTQARLAPSIDDATILRRIRRKVEDLGLPDAAKEVSIRRTLRPREIVIKTSYEETLELPFVRHTFALTPEVKSPL
jgi:hypothetical protein